MAELEYVGKVQNTNKSIATRGYSLGKVDLNLSPVLIDLQINLAFSSFANKSYVDSQDATLATKAYIDSKDALKIPLASKDQANGVPGLDAQGRVLGNKVSAPSTQRWLRSFWSPSAYNSGTITCNSTTETLIYPVTITDPGYAYKLMVWGEADGLTASETVYPQILVRAGDTNGQIIAKGLGLQDTYSILGGDFFERSTSNLGGAQFWNETYLDGGGGNAYCDGHNCEWDKSGASNDRKLIARKIGTIPTTEDDWQEIKYICSSSVEGGSAFGSPAHNKIFSRMSTDQTNFVAVDMTDSQANLTYSVGSESGSVASGSIDQSSGDTIRFQAGISGGAGKRGFALWRNSSNILNWNDNSNLSQMGGAYRGWGFGMRPGNNEIFLVSVSQAAPAGMSEITINDLPPGTTITPLAPISIIPSGLATQTVRTGAVTLYLKLVRSIASSSVSVTNFRPNLHVTAIPA